MICKEHSTQAMQNTLLIFFRAKRRRDYNIDGGFARTMNGFLDGLILPESTIKRIKSPTEWCNTPGNHW